jgi:PPM family protein phosphatase
VGLEAFAAALSRPRPGRARDDSTLVTQRLFAVADGADLGAGAGGQALVQLQRLIGPYPTARGLAQALKAVNFALWQRDDGAGALRSTITAGVLLGSRLAIGHVGDSRAYLLRGRRLHRLTSDDSAPSSYKSDDGVPRLGCRPPEATPHVRRYLVQDGDRLILCTDGLWRGVSDRELVLTGGLAPPVACELLCSRSLADEEASVVVVDLSEVGLASPGLGP